MATSDRSSEAAEPPLVTEKLEIARIEAANTLRQFDAGMQELQKHLADPRHKLKPSTILSLNRMALEGLSKYAGVYRPGTVEIKGSKHAPVSAADVPRLVEDFCDYIDNNWDKSAVHLAAYALWRLNWIHPFVDGNGRTARIVSYVLLCARLGYRLPGTQTIPEQIAANKQPYYHALEAADLTNINGQPDVSKMEELIANHLANQLVGIHNHAIGHKLEEGQKPDANAKRREPSSYVSRVTLMIETHPALTGAIAVLIAAVIAIIFAH